MAESKAARNFVCMKIKTSMETSSSLKEDSSTDQTFSMSSWSSYSDDDGLCFCPDCRWEMFESTSATSSEGEEDESMNAYDSSETDLSNLSDTTYSSSGSGYMSASSSLDESRSSEEGSDTSRYYCDRSASSSSSLDTDDGDSVSMHGDDSSYISISERGCPKRKFVCLQNEE